MTQTIFPNSTTNATVYDDLARVKFSVDARGTTNAFGYDLLGRRVAVTNAWRTSAAMTNLFAFDASGNQVYFTNSMNVVTTNYDQREDIFFDDVDRHDFIKTLAETCQKTDWQVHAFCQQDTPVLRQELERPMERRRWRKWTPRH